MVLERREGKILLPLSPRSGTIFCFVNLQRFSQKKALVGVARKNGRERGEQPVQKKSNGKTNAEIKEEEIRQIEEKFGGRPLKEMLYNLFYRQGRTAVEIRDILALPNTDGVYTYLEKCGISPKMLPFEYRKKLDRLAEGNINDTLGPDARKLLERRVREGKTGEQIATEIGHPERTVWEWMSKLRVRRQDLEREYVLIAQERDLLRKLSPLTQKILRTRYLSIDQGSVLEAGRIIKVLGLKIKESRVRQIVREGIKDLRDLLKDTD